MLGVGLTKKSGGGPGRGPTPRRRMAMSWSNADLLFEVADPARVLGSGNQVPVGVDRHLQAPRDEWS